MLSPRVQNPSRNPPVGPRLTLADRTLIPFDEAHAMAVRIRHFDLFSACVGVAVGGRL
jgi:hypothetical protein